MGPRIGLPSRNVSLRRLLEIGTRKSEGRALGDEMRWWVQRWARGASSAGGAQDQPFPRQLSCPSLTRARPIPVPSRHRLTRRSRGRPAPHFRFTWEEAGAQRGWGAHHATGRWRSHDPVLGRCGFPILTPALEHVGGDDNSFCHKYEKFAVSRNPGTRDQITVNKSACQASTGGL